MERKLIAAAVSSALALPMAAQAIEFSVSGHVNRAIVLENQDGNDNDGELRHVDSNASQSRFRFTGSEDIGNGMTAGVNMELGVLSTGGSSGTTTRHAAVYLSTAGGKLTLGHTGVATDGATNARLGGPSWLAGVTNWCAYASPSGAAACQTYDGTRTDILRYDTPSLGPVSLSVSIGDNDYKDAMAKVAGSFGDSAYDLRVGWTGKDDDDEDDIIAASGALKFGTGTAVAVAWASTDQGAGENNQYTHFEIDQSYGDGSIGAYYKTGEMNDMDGNLWGVGVGHNVGGGVTAYAGYRRIEDDTAGFEDHNLFVAGMRVTFK